MKDFMPLRSISNNDLKVMQVSLNHDGSLIAGLFEDDTKNNESKGGSGSGENKKFYVEIYDFNYDDPMQCGRSLFSHQTIYEK